LKRLFCTYRRFGKQLLLTVVAGGTVLQVSCLENPTAFWAASLGQLGGSIATEYIRGVVYQMLEVQPLFRF
jgi:hypothetical protein